LNLTVLIDYPPEPSREAQLVRELRLGLAVHPARRLIEREHRRRLTVASDDRKGQALALAA